MKEIKDIVIVGGGTAGLISALILKHSFSQKNIRLIKSPKTGIIGVGEGTSFPFNIFVKEANIDPIELINNTDATIKTGILFKDWNYKNHTYIHSDDGYPIENNNLNLYNSQVLNNPHNSPFILSNEFSRIYYNHILRIPPSLNNIYQYHFDTYKLNNYLLNKCKERGIAIEDDTITNINQDNKGNIVSIIGSNKNLITGDFFIDCSGFKKVLSSKLGAKWISYSEFLPLNQSITVSTPLNKNNFIEPYTTTTSLPNGWVWKIPTQSRYGNGYVFSNNYINSDNALNELNQHLGINVEKQAKDIKFEAGKINKFWINNCLSIGLSSSFVEPLEAQSIGFSIIQVLAFTQYYSEWILNSHISEKYNQTLNNSFDNIVDYVQLHYLTQRKDSLFWKEKAFNLTPFNKLTFNRFSKGNFNTTDLTDSYLMFRAANFYQVYYGLNHITPSTLLKPHTPLPSPYYNIDKNYNLMYHNDYLKLLKSNTFY